MLFTSKVLTTLEYDKIIEMLNYKPENMGKLIRIPAEIFGRKAVADEIFNTERKCVYCKLDHIYNAARVAVLAGKALLARPSSVAVHNYSDVLGNTNSSICHSLISD